jgi:hypothetical protein
MLGIQEVDRATHGLRTISHLSIKKSETCIGIRPKAFFIGNVQGLREWLQEVTGEVCTMCCNLEPSDLITYSINSNGEPMPICDHCRARV